MTTSAPTNIRLRLLERGYCPLPVCGKNPDVNGKGWQEKRQQTNAQEIRLWPRVFPSALNTSVLCQRTPFLDLDILNSAAAKAAEQLVLSRFEDGRLLVRFGQRPKRAIPFKTTMPFKKISVVLIPPNAETLPEKQREQKIEFLCDGQQCVVAGTHPDTNKPYNWHGGALWDTPRDDLPSITAERAQQLVDDIVELLATSFGYHRKDARARDLRQDRQLAGAAGVEGDSRSFLATICAKLDQGRR